MQLLHPYFIVWYKLFSMCGLIFDLGVSNRTQVRLTVQVTEQYEKTLTGQESSLILREILSVSSGTIKWFLRLLSKSRIHGIYRRDNVIILIAKID